VEQLEDTIVHLASFISSFANIIMQLDSVDEGYIENLERVVGTLFIIFPQLYPHQRTAHYYALSRLFIALFAKQGSLKTLLSRVGE
jgi:hypothetical protein